ncbi:MAG: hypothetical protein D6814_16120, partial [Calditrichaeota bacterium]
MGAGVYDLPSIADKEQNSPDNHQDSKPNGKCNSIKNQIFAPDSQCIATIGGTFDVLHSGHREYIQIAFKYAEKVIIYLSTDSFAEKIKKYHITPYRLREKKLREYLAKIYAPSRYVVRPLDNLDQINYDYLLNVGLREKLSLAV